MRHKVVVCHLAKAKKNTFISSKHLYIHLFTHSPVRENWGNSLPLMCIWRMHRALLSKTPMSELDGGSAILPLE